MLCSFFIAKKNQKASARKRSYPPTNDTKNSKLLRQTLEFFTFTFCGGSQLNLSYAQLENHSRSILISLTDKI
jgi:hypothetical protein